MIIQFLAACGGTLAFAILFQAPPRQWAFCALVGGVGGLVDLALRQAGLSAAIACLCATFVLFLLARLFSVVRRAPVTVFLIAGIFPLVPGAGIYYTAFYFVDGNPAQAGAYGFSTLMTAGAIALGILFGSSIPQSLFAKLAGLVQRRRP